LIFKEQMLSPAPHPNFQDGG